MELYSDGNNGYSDTVSDPQRLVFNKCNWNREEKIVMEEKGEKNKRVRNLEWRKFMCVVCEIYGRRRQETKRKSCNAPDLILSSIVERWKSKHYFWEYQLKVHVDISGNWESEYFDMKYNKELNASR